MINNEPLMKNNLLHRASLRGLKKCTSCGYITGQRALICRNVGCDLRIKRLAAIKPFDPIQLVTNGHIKLFSLRSKEKLLQPRNFVSITESQESIITRPCAVCYVDNCKYDCTEPTHLVCRHIKACKVLTNVAVAEIYPIDTGVLWSLNIPTEQKQRLWKLYQKEEMLMQPVQKLNSSIFVVKCEESNIFPVGRLHIVISTSKVPSKNGIFFCSCKKLKIMLEPDNSVIMKQEICDHVLLLLAAILSKPEAKKLYSKFLDLLQHLWMPNTLNKPIDCEIRPTELMTNGLQSGKYFKSNMKEDSIAISGDSSDIFHFDEELFAENNMPDFYDIILGTNVDKDTNAQTLHTTEQVNSVKYIKDPKLNALESSLTEEEMDLSFQTFNSPVSLTCLDEGMTQTPLHFSENYLNVIEQFQLNHNIQISNDNIELAKDIESLNNMESSLIETHTGISASMPKQKSLLKTYPICNNPIEIPPTKSNINVNCLKTPTAPTQKSIVLKQGPVKIVKIATPLMVSPIKQCSKIIQIVKISPKKVMVLKSNQNDEDAKQDVNQLEALQSKLIEDKETHFETLPSLTYESWMDHIIEVINENVAVNHSPLVQNTFNVPEDFFNCFSKTFISSNKTKLASKTLVVKNEKHKNHTKYLWHFSQASDVQQIFTSRNSKIELERLYKRLPDNNYELFTPTKIKCTDNHNFRTIYPKVQLYKAFIKFPKNSDLSCDNLRPDCSFRLEWLPAAFPKSNFGLMTIQFCVSIKELDGTNCT